MTLFRRRDGHYQNAFNASHVHAFYDFYAATLGRKMSLLHLHARAFQISQTSNSIMIISDYAYGPFSFYGQILVICLALLALLPGRGALWWWWFRQAAIYLLWYYYIIFIDAMPILYIHTFRHAAAILAFHAEYSLFRRRAILRASAKISIAIPTSHHHAWFPILIYSWLVGTWSSHYLFKSFWERRISHWY